jgi:hypothetical protein
MSDVYDISSCVSIGPQFFFYVLNGNGMMEVAKHYAVRPVLLKLVCVMYDVLVVQIANELTVAFSGVGVYFYSIV